MSQSQRTVARASSILAILTLAATGCAVDATGENAQSSDQAIITPQTSVPTYWGTALLWQNMSTGQVSAWELNGSTVTGTENLSWTCGASNGCSNQWQPVDTLSNSILWDNPTTGQVQTWSFDQYGNVDADPALSWTCTAASGCSSAWKPVGRTTLGGKQGLLWHDASTGALSVWNLDNSSVTGTTPLSWTCDATCSATWHTMRIGDFNSDGNSDVVWLNVQTGQVSIWLLNGSGTVTGTQTVSQSCTLASGCLVRPCTASMCAQSGPTWQVVGTGDVNGDGRADLTWFDPISGNVTSWLLNGAGTYIGTQTLNWQCSAASGCSAAWRPLGFVKFPSSSITCAWGENDSYGSSLGSHGFGLTLNYNGSYTFSGNFWENIPFTRLNEGVVLAIQGANGEVFTFDHGGSMQGVGSQNDNWSTPGTDTRIAGAWADLQRGHCVQNSSFSLSVGAIWSDIAGGLTGGAIVPIVGNLN